MTDRFDRYRANLEDERKWLFHIAQGLTGIHGLLAAQPWLQSTYDAFKAAYDAAEARRVEMLQALDTLAPNPAFGGLGHKVVRIQHSAAHYRKPSDTFRLTLLDHINEALAPVAAAVQQGQATEGQLDALIAIYDELESHPLEVCEKKDKYAWLTHLSAFLAGGVADWMVLRGGYRVFTGGQPQLQGGT